MPVHEIGGAEVLEIGNIHSSITALTENFEREKI